MAEHELDPVATASQAAALKAATASAAKPRAKAMTQAQLVSRLFRLLGKAEQGRARSMVSIGTGPRGQVMPSVSVYAGDPPELIRAAEREAIELYERLRAKYPIAAGSE